MYYNKDQIKNYMLRAMNIERNTCLIHHPFIAKYFFLTPQKLRQNK